jgi:putative transposase
MDTDADRVREIALFRYSLARGAADAALSARQRGAMVRELAARQHLGPDGRWITVSRATLDRWVRYCRAGGFQALLPARRRVQNKTPERILHLALALRREQSARTAAQIRRIILETEGAAPSERTIQRHLLAAGLFWKGEVSSRALGRFEACAPNELWTGDALHGPAIAGKRAILFCYIDDHSRLLCGYRWALREDVMSAGQALREGMAARGLPGALYLDNGSPFVSSQLLRSCAVLGIRLIHSRPGRPEGRGKIERVFRTIRSQFLVELEGRELASVTELEGYFQAWVESIYHRRIHTETGQSPLERFLAAGAPAGVEQARLREAFLWSEARTVSKTATFSLHGNTYEVEPELAGFRVQVVFDPLALAEIEVRLAGRPAGRAVPLEIRRHVHPRARSADPEQAPSTKIDYLRLISERHVDGMRRRIDYRDLPKDDQTGQAKEAER